MSTEPNIGPAVKSLCAIRAWDKLAITDTEYIDLAITDGEIRTVSAGIKDTNSPRRLAGGDKLPSLRQTVADSGLSLMTVLNAYQLLESQGVITAQAKSGYWWRQPETFRYPDRQRQIYLSDKVDINEFVFSVWASKQAGIVPFGSGFPDPSLFRSKRWRAR